MHAGPERPILSASISCLFSHSTVCSPLNKNWITVWHCWGGNITFKFKEELQYKNGTALLFVKTTFPSYASPHPFCLVPVILLQWFIFVSSS